MNATERLHQGIKGHADQQSKDEYWHTQPTPMAGSPRHFISLLSVGEGNDEGMTEGIYAVTNISPQDYERYISCQVAVRAHISRSLREVADFREGFELIFSQKTEGGSAVFKIQPQEP